MSFILDALKKAEAERQRQSGPTLLELRVTAPRRRWPAWSVLIGILLIANIIVVLGTALRSRPPAEPQSATASQSAPIPVVPTVLTTVPAAVSVPAARDAAIAVPASLAPGATESGDEAAQPLARMQGQNPADDEPAVPGPKSELALPSQDELGGTVPALRLDLHVYAERAADRYALINMHKAREGDLLPEGARVVTIDRDGVELDYRGTHFMLRPQ